MTGYLGLGVAGSFLPRLHPHGGRGCEAERHLMADGHEIQVLIKLGPSYTQYIIKC